MQRVGYLGCPTIINVKSRGDVLVTIDLMASQAALEPFPNALARSYRDIYVQSFPLPCLPYAGKLFEPCAKSIIIGTSVLMNEGKRRGKMPPVRDAAGVAAIGHRPARAEE